MSFSPLLYVNNVFRMCVVCFLSLLISTKTSIQKSRYCWKTLAFTGMTISTIVVMKLAITEALLTSISDEQLSRGAEEQRSRGAEEQRSR